MFQRITFNLSPVSWRYETLEGRKHLVVPTVMINEGVHPGSEGPLLYENEQLARSVRTWDHKPFVINHPTINNQPVSACDPKAIEQFKVGILLNNNFDGRLRCESWLEEDRLVVLSRDTFDAIKNNRTTEVSTGLHHNLDARPGVWNGQAFNGRVLDIVGDHLAALPGGVGACSVAKGAGLLRNAEEASYNDIRDQLRTLLCEREKAAMAATMVPAVSADEYDGPSSYCYIVDLFSNYVIYESGDSTYRQGYKTRAGKVKLDGDPSEVRRKVSYVTVNLGDCLISGHEQILRFDLPAVGDAGRITPQQSHKTLNHEEPNPMPPTTTQTGAAAPTTNTPAAGTVPDRGQQINGLIAAGVASEADRGALTQLSEPVFTKLYGTAAPGNAAAQLGLNTQPPAPALNTQQLNAMLAQLASAQVPTGQPVANAGANIPVAQPVSVPAQMTEEQFINFAPPSIREIITNHKAQAEAERQQLITLITNSPTNKFNPDWLKEQPSDFLRALATLARPQQAPPTGNFTGQAGVPSMFIVPNTTVNSADQGGDDNEVLGLPGMFSANDFKNGAA